MIWGVLATDGAHPALLARWRPVLCERLDGLVATDHGLLAGLRDVPADVDEIVFIEGRALASLTVDDLTELLACLTADVAAAVRAVPVTDALKRVAGDRVVGIADRRSLVTIQTPHVVRRSALEEALLLAPHGASGDPAALLISAGHQVRVVELAPGRR